MSLKFLKNQCHDHCKLSIVMILMNPTVFVMISMKVMMMMITFAMITMIVSMIWEWFSPWKVPSTCPSPVWRQVDLCGWKFTAGGVQTSSNEQTLLKNKNWATCGLRHLPLLRWKRWMLHRREPSLLCRGRAENQGVCLESHTWGP